jgi:hypothetical protein
MSKHPGVDRRALFLKTCIDLQEKVTSHDAYETLRASALIRQLFLDEGNSLVDQVNRKARVRLSFNIVEFSPSAANQMEIFLAPDGLDPDAYDSLPKGAPARKTATRDQFFSAPIGIVHGKLITALDVVRHVAFTMGGIHAGMPKTEQDHELEKIGKQLHIGGLNPAIRIVRAAGKGCVRALEPLRAAVAASLAAEKPPRARQQPSNSTGDRLTTLVTPTPSTDWSVGHHLFCVLEIRGRPKSAAILLSYGVSSGPRICLSVDSDGARVRLIDARGILHDEVVDFNRLPMVEGTRHLLHYEVTRVTPGHEWAAVISLDGLDTSRSVFSAQLDIVNGDNETFAAHRVEDVLAVHAMGHGPVPANEPTYRRQLYEWAQAEFGVPYLVSLR